MSLLHTSPSDDDLPGVFKSADEISQEAQKEYLRWTRGRLQLAVVAAIAGTVTVSSNDGTWVEKASATLALVSFAAALLLEVFLLRGSPEERWYHGRALAESVKTLAWRYMAAAEPFPSSLPPIRADEILLARIQDLFREASPNLPSLSVGAVQATAKMREVRESQLESRKAIYLEFRVSDQQAWYEKKAKANEGNSRRWRFTLISFELIGVIVTTITLLDVSEIDIGGAVAAAIAAAGAWLEVKQYDNLASAYSLTAAELAFVHATGSGISDETKWSDYVISAEQAISREHTMWLARRVGLRAARRSG
ncbi:DUF4231 domain-containing protein [Streptomyces prunicolor]|uniref:DUF4231 domain-containing protein n=1 Tax=Streptomyces prunicolor TaxID=67348 RepID=UPI0038689E4C|nr:DUF4231 domain-containing protein [Streptomyces prunicolor]